MFGPLYARLVAVPVVADKLIGKKFERFDDFREAFWLAVAECPELMVQFNRSNQTMIRAGNSPFAIPEEQVGKRKRFEIHHVKNIQHSGEVYNIDNLRVNTPKNHIGLH
ncbi:HNH endonuclease [Pectobacterium brasiliense]|uniref:HNH endonuclease n=1 Tax=Pectobacterium brasiliense TaxID=180957 RepID=UPI001968D9E9|nr:HNH endonuclease [Pectobacterium brasiliense]MBN3131922.1 HNH endonuclease [Pectobacterium brasiliense]